MTTLTVIPVRENAYGHLKRLHWFLSQIDKTQRILEVGCGTGFMITLPLATLGYSIQGLDRDHASIVYGKNLLSHHGIDPEIIRTKNLEELDGKVDVIILSEVLEHIPDQEQSILFNGISAKLRPGGLLLITVPNGYGWFEMESFLWNRVGLGDLLHRLGIDNLFIGAKHRLFGYEVDKYVSSLDSSPHVQRFTYRSIQDLLRHNGFKVVKVTGSVLFAGPFSNMAFAGIPPLMAVNNWLGSRLAPLASGYFLASVLTDYE